MTSISSFDEFVKSPHDKSLYRLITLPNKLQAMLVSEPGLEKASAALDVHIGFFSDPKNIPGLAHFLEHLLFMGTEKYPKENEYSQYLSEHGGSSNAFTCEEHTNYFFDVAPDALYGALDRFAQFFIAPLFDPSGTEREMRAVDSENKKNLNNDHWRLNQLEKHLSNPEHSYSKFGTGNLETLNVPSIRETLIKFHESFYSANLMKLVVYGRESLDQLQVWATEMFTSVRNCDVVRPEWPGLPWKLEDLPAHQFIEAKTLKEMKSLNMTWLIPDQRPHYLTKPESYLTHLIGHEGEGSLFQALKKRGWLTSLSAGCDSDAHGYNFFQISIDLSPLGWDNYENVIKWTVQYISTLRVHGPQERIFQECKQLSEISFKFREKGDPSDFTHQLANWMQKYQMEPRLMLAGPFISEVYDAECIRQLINGLTCDKMRVTRASINLNITENAKDILTEPWYGTEYFTGPLSEGLLKQLSALEAGQEILEDSLSELYLPAPNIYLPTNFNIPISPSLSDPSKKPQLLRSSEGINLWYKLDDTFEQPKSQVNLFFRTEMLNVTPQHAQRGLLFKDLLKHSLILYDATLAGLHYDFAVLATGFEVKISGFSDKLSILLEKCLEAFVSIKFSVIDFEVIRDRQLRSLNNFPREAPYWHASYHLNSLLCESFHPIASRIKVLKEMKAEEEVNIFNSLNYFKNEIVKSGVIECLIHGSLEGAEVEKIYNLIDDLYKSVNGCQSDDNISNNNNSIRQQRVVKFERPAELIHIPTTSAALDNPNCSIEVFFPITIMSDVKGRTLTSLFIQIFNEPFFDTLRTAEQLGYLVTHGLREKGVLTGLRFLIQSERDPIYLETRIEAFLSESVPKIMEKMSESDFDLHRSALKLELTQKKKTLFGESKQHWEVILSGSEDFERPWKDAETLDSISRSDLAEFYETFLKFGAPQRTKSSVHIWSKTQFETLKPDYPSNPLTKNNTFIINRDEFVKSMELYPSIYKVI